MDTELQPLILDPDQLSLFPPDPTEKAIERLLTYLLEDKEEIDQLHTTMQKVLDGEPGYARNPRPQTDAP
jgi:hypothetical protein